MLPMRMPLAGIHEHGKFVSRKRKDRTVQRPCKFCSACTMIRITAVIPSTGIVQEREEFDHPRIGPG